MSKLKIDLRFTLVHYELWALEEHLKLLEEQIQFAEEQVPLRARAWLKETGYEHDEAESQIALADAWEVSKEILPRHLRGSFLVLLWASVELSIRVIAEVLAREAKTGLRLDDLRGENFLDRAKRYFKKVLGRELPTGSTEWQKIVFLYSLRNSIAHSNGRLGRTKTTDRDQIKAWTERYPDLNKGDGILRFGAPLVQDLFAAVCTWIEVLTDQLEQELRDQKAQRRPGT